MTIGPRFPAIVSIASAVGVKERGPDMRPSSMPEHAHDWAQAPGYRAVMHRSCIGCHEQSAAAGGRGDQLLAEHLTRCSTCHPGLEPRQARTAPEQLADARPAVVR